MITFDPVNYGTIPIDVKIYSKILAATDEAGADDNMTVAEVVGCLEMCKASIIEKAFS